MKSMCAVCVGLLGVWAAGAQTTTSEGVRPVYVAHLALRPVERVPDRAEPPPTIASVPAPAEGLTAASSFSASLQVRSEEGLRGFQAEVFRRMDQEGCFNRPERPPDSAVMRWAQGTFREEEIKMGKTKMSCSLYTAIKHKNPLCLLNPVFLHLSW